MAESSVQTSVMQGAREPKEDTRLIEMYNNVCEDSNVRDSIVKEATLADSLDDAEGYVSLPWARSQLSPY